MYNLTRKALCLSLASSVEANIIKKPYPNMITPGVRLRAEKISRGMRLLMLLNRNKNTRGISRPSIMEMGSRLISFRLRSANPSSFMRWWF